MRPEELPAFDIKIMHRRFKDCAYIDRNINLKFEEELMRMFKIVSPVAGAIINIECRMIIDIIEYTDEKIIIWVTNI